jgi:hypothetical protein
MSTRVIPESPAITQPPEGLAFTHYDAEASDLGFDQFPHAISYKGVTYQAPTPLLDAEGETYGVQYRNGLNTFTVWND